MNDTSKNVTVTAQLPLPDLYGTQACVRLYPQHSFANVVENVLIDIRSSHAKDEYVCIYGLAIMVESDMTEDLATVSAANGLAGS
jgi:hypothetical protein